MSMPPLESSVSALRSTLPATYTTQQVTEQVHEGENIEHVWKTTFADADIT